MREVDSGVESTQDGYVEVARERDDVVMEWNTCGRENTLYDTYTDTQAR